MRCTLIVAIVTGILLLSTSAFADVITLTNGKILEGKATDNGDTVTVELAFGTVRLSKSQVKSIASATAPIDEFKTRSAQLDAKAGAGQNQAGELADDWYALALWAEQHGLPEQNRTALAQTLTLNPDHAAARADAGFVQYDGKWVTVAEKTRALGLVLLHGKWVSPPPPPPVYVPPVRSAEELLRDENEQLRQQLSSLQDTTNALLNRADSQPQIVYAPADPGVDVIPAPPPEPVLPSAPPPPTPPSPSNPSHTLPAPLATPPQFPPPKQESLATPPTLRM